MEENSDYRGFLIREFLKTKSNDIKLQIEGYTNIIKFCTTKNWRVYLDIISTTIKRNKDLISPFYEFLSITHVNEELIRKCDFAEENFYKLSVNSDQNENKIISIAVSAFEMGDFKLYIKIFERFAKFFNNLGENPFHDHLLNLLLAIILLQQENTFTVFKKLEFDSFWEMNTYDFVLSLLMNNFSSAYRDLFTISTEVYDDFYFIIDKEKFILVCVLIFVLEGTSEDKIKIFDNPKLILFKHRRNPIIKNLIESMKEFNYSKCLELFENLVDQLSKDILLKFMLNGMVMNLKRKYLRYLIQNSSAVTVDYLGKTLKMREDTILEFVINDIRSNILDVKIDNINKIIYTNKFDELNNTLKSTSDVVLNLYITNYQKYVQTIGDKTISISQDDYNKLETLN